MYTKGNRFLSILSQQHDASQSSQVVDGILQNVVTGHEVVAVLGLGLNEERKKTELFKM